MIQHRINLDNTVLDDLDRVAMDPFSNLISGKPTSLMANPLDETISNSAVAGRFKYASQLIASPPTLPDPTELAMKIQDAVMNDIVAFATSYTQEKFADLMTPPTISEIMSGAMAYIQDYTKSPAEVLEDFIFGEDQQRENDMNTDIQEALSIVNQYIDSYVGKALAEVDKVIAKAMDKIDPDGKRTEGIFRYITQGPQYVESCIELADAEAVAFIEKNVNQAYEFLNKYKQAAVDALKNKIAAAMAEKINAKIRDTVAEAQKKKERLLAKVKIKAKGVLRAVILNLRVLMGS